MTPPLPFPSDLLPPERDARIHGKVVAAIADRELAALASDRDAPIVVWP